MNYIETENARKLINKLRRYTNKPIEIKDLAEFASYPSSAYMVNYLGAAKEYTNKIEVHLNFTKDEDVREAVFVHELLHIVLHHEGFPSIATRADLVRFLQPSDAQALDKLRDRFSSTIDHLQVYKRMITEFHLNLNFTLRSKFSRKSVDSESSLMTLTLKTRNTILLFNRTY